ncbi:MAG: hypothetical protein KDA20_10545 [Phycisphaerales bacterium]|nr:hypothetical protein [Phycisphaerales bacterium]
MKTAGLAGIGIAIALSGVARGQVVTLEGVALALVPAFGPGGGAKWSTLDTPLISPDGNLVFQARLDAGPGVAPNGVWYGDTGAFTELAGPNTLPPGIPAGINWYAVPETYTPVMTPDGLIAFRATLLGGGVATNEDKGIWAGLPGSIQLVARENDNLTGVAGEAIDEITSVSNGPSLSNGRLAFHARIRGASSLNDYATWLWEPGAGLTMLVREGDPVPGGLSATFANNLGTGINVAPDGSVWFNSALAGAGIDTTNDDSLWYGQPGALQLVAREGDQAPGLDPGITLRNSARLDSANALGTLLFDSRIQGPGITSGQNDACLWMGTPGSFDVLMRQGDPLPGGGPGIVTGLSEAHLNDSGQVLSSVLTSEGFGLLLGSQGNLAPIVREYWPAPGAGDGAAFHAGDFSQCFRFARINDAGQVAFVGRVSGPGIAGSYAQGIWVHNPGAGLALVAMEGQQIMPGDTSTRTIATIDVRLDFPSSGRGTWFTTDTEGNGVLAFRFTDTFGTQNIMRATIKRITCPGDADADNDVDIDDLSVVLFNYGTAGPDGDLNGDGVVDLVDLNLLLFHFGTVCPV